MDNKKINIEEQQLYMEIPNIVNGQGKTMLYLGASFWRAYLLEEFKSYGYSIDIIEINKFNIDHVRNTYKVNVIEGNFKNVLSLTNKNYDVAVWWHGPEHYPKAELPQLLLDLESRCSSVILACPKGYSPQDADFFQNPYEAHLWNVEPEDFLSLGYNVKSFSRTPNPDGIMAWKHKPDCFLTFPNTNPIVPRSCDIFPSPIVPPPPLVPDIKPIIPQSCDTLSPHTENPNNSQSYEPDVSISPHHHRRAPIHPK